MFKNAPPGWTIKLVKQVRWRRENLYQSYTLKLFNYSYATNMQLSSSCRRRFCIPSNLYHKWLLLSVGSISPFLLSSLFHISLNNHRCYCKNNASHYFTSYTHNFLLCEALLYLIPFIIKS
jgi:hypothetical protein